MRLSTIPAFLALLLHARLALGETFSIPLELRGLDDIGLGVDDNLEPWDDDFPAGPPGLKVPGTNPLYLCGQDDSGDLIKIENIDFSPAKPVRGAELVVLAKGNVIETIEKGTTVRVQVHLAGSKVVDKKYDLCEGLKRFGLSCPFQPCAVEITKAFKIPKKVPHGHYSARIKAYTPEKKQLTCLVMSMKA